MLTTYTISRRFDDEEAIHTTVTVADRDAINCAHLIAAAFNTMSRNFMLGFAMGVVDTQNGTVQFDGKVEELKKPDPWSVSQTFTFNPTAGDADTILTLFGDGETPTFTAAGKFSFAESATDDEVMPKAADDLAKASYGHIARSVLETGYVELQRAQDALFEAGFETIPAERGVKDMHSIIRSRDAQISELAQELVNANERIAELERRDEHERYARQTMERKHGEEKEALRAEMTGYIRGERAKWKAAEQRAPVNEEHMHAWYRGMIDVLARFLVAIGETDPDDAPHAYARRLVENPED